MGLRDHCITLSVPPAQFPHGSFESWLNFRDSLVLLDGLPFGHSQGTLVLCGTPLSKQICLTLNSHFRHLRLSAQKGLPGLLRVASPKWLRILIGKNAKNGWWTQNPMQMMLTNEHSDPHFADQFDVVSFLVPSDEQGP